MTARGDDAWDPRDHGHGRSEFAPPDPPSETPPEPPAGSPPATPGPEPEGPPFGADRDDPYGPDETDVESWDADWSGLEDRGPADAGGRDELDPDELDELSDLESDDEPARYAGAYPDPASSPLLPRDDRLWRHPSELKFEQAATAPPTPSWARILVAATIAGAVAGGVVTGVVLRYGDSADGGTRVVERQAVVPASVTSIGDPSSLDVVAIADSALPSIVRVEVLDESGDPMSSGSGVIVQDDGHIVTNAHVVEGGSVVEAILADGRRFEAGLVGVDALTDLAVLKIADQAPLPTALLGSTAGLQVGEPAVAIGSPLGLSGGPTVTLGVISAVGRELQASTGPRLYDLVQTDAPIMSGSSGGALLDRHAAVIGITTAVAISDTGAEGLGFAIPIEIAHAVATDLIETGRARHGYLGVDAADLSNDQATTLGVDGGAVVAEVEAGSPADDAGLQPGDVVVAVDGEPVRSMSALIVSIRLSEPGSIVRFTVERSGGQLDVPVTMGERR